MPQRTHRTQRQVGVLRIGALPRTPKVLRVSASLREIMILHALLLFVAKQSFRVIRIIRG